MDRIYGMAIFGAICWFVINQSNNNGQNMDIPFDNSVVELRIHICCIEQQIELLSSLFAIPTFLAGFAHTSNLYILE